MRYSTSNYYYPKSLKEEVVSVYLRGENSCEELSRFYKIKAGTIRAWICRYRERENIVSLQSQIQPKEKMPRKKKEPEKTLDVSSLEARIRELEMENLALNTLIDVAERNGMDIRKKSGAKQ